MLTSTILLSFLSASLTLAAPQQATATHSSSPPQPTSTLPPIGLNPPDPKINQVANNLTVVDALLSAPRASSRLNLLSSDSDFIFSYKSPPTGAANKAGKGGATVSADRVSFPALIGTSAAMTVGFLGPCGFNTPHVHLRSAELLVLISGSLSTQFILENGSRTVSTNLEPWQLTVFPQGSLHTQFNPECEPATFVASFASEDPGTRQEAQAFFGGLDEDVVKAAIGQGFAFEGKDVAKFVDLIPANVALGVQSCLKKCGIVAA